MINTQSALFIILVSIAFHAFAIGRGGEQAYQEVCAACHDNATARTPARSVIADYPASRIVQALETGNMRVIGTFSMTGPKRIAVAEYLSCEKYDENWASNNTNQCEPETWPQGNPLTQANWNGWGNGLENQRRQTFAAGGINSANVGELELAWAFALPGETYSESQPTVVGNRVFLGSPNGIVYALDAISGCTHWTYQADGAVKSPVTIGELADNSFGVFFGDQAGNAYSLSAADGTLRWKDKVNDHPSARVTGGVQVYQGRVYVPMASLEEALAMDPNYICCIFRGSVTAYDINSGERIWQRYTIDQEPTTPSKDSHGKPMVGPSGASVWSAVTIDPQRKRIYVGTGDNYSNPPTDSSDSILALDLDSGEIVWRYQGLAGDAWTVGCMAVPQVNCPEGEGPDEDMGASPILTINETGKVIIVATQKSRDAHAIDPDKQGELIWRKKFAKGGIQGGFQWGQASDGKAMYASISDTRWLSKSSISADSLLDPSAGGGLVAIDINNGNLLWKAEPSKCDSRPRCSPSQSAGVSLIGDVVISGAQSGVVFAFDKNTGKELWRFDSYREFDTVNGALGRGGAIDQSGAVAVNGMLYFNSGYSKFAGNPGNVLLAFKLK